MALRTGKISLCLLLIDTRSFIWSKTLKLARRVVKWKAKPNGQRCAKERRTGLWSSGADKGEINLLSWWNTESKRGMTSVRSFSEHGESSEDTSRDAVSKWAACVGTYSISIDLTISSYIEQPTSSVIGSSAKSLTIWEELHSIDIWLMASKGLHCFTGTNIPKLGKCIACTGDKNILISRVYTDAHHIP